MAPSVFALPPEIWMQVASFSTNHRVFKFTDEAKRTLLNLSLVNHDLHELSNSVLYSRIRVEHHQISRLRATLYPSGGLKQTSHSITLSKYVHSLCIVIRSWGVPDPRVRSGLIEDAMVVLHAVASTLHRLFLDVDPVEAELYGTKSPFPPFTLYGAIMSLRQVSELVVGDDQQGYMGPRGVGWSHELSIPPSGPSRLSKTLVKLTVADVSPTVDDIATIMNHFQNLKRLTLICPPLYNSLVCALPKLLPTAPFQGLQKITFVVMKYQGVEDRPDFVALLDAPEMVPYRHKVAIEAVLDMPHGIEPVWVMLAKLLEVGDLLY
ncbi:hypothetical protein FRB94_000294 [Tulasnella sp. JGI-2019a]|nr:hypothetical protein FRB93_003217 [Tulasnella sp. JGI-2019a]KAG9006883.1 hypothetical protein FRB94_000294 [Tulasnella sp. JGI-2019a]